MTAQSKHAADSLVLKSYCCSSLDVLILCLVMGLWNANREIAHSNLYIYINICLIMECSEMKIMHYVLYIHACIRTNPKFKHIFINDSYKSELKYDNLE